MADFDIIPVEARADAGKGASRALRRAGRVPGVVYGGKLAPTHVSIDGTLLMKQLQQGSFTAKLFELRLDDRNQKVLAREVQLHPVTDRPLHVDFLRIAEDAEIVIEVAVRFTDEEACEGLRQGGVLNIVRHTIELRCPATAIPEAIEISLAGREIGDSVHISQVKLPEGATPTITDRDFTILTIASPTVHVEEEAAAAEGEELPEGEAAPAEGEAAPAEGEAEKEPSGEGEG